MVEETGVAGGLANSVSGSMEFGGTASNQNEIGSSPSGPHRFDVSPINGLSVSSSAACEKDILSCSLVSSLDGKNNELAK